MDNSFSKEERLAWEDILEGFRNALVQSRFVTKNAIDQTMMERTGDILWYPEPYILTSYSGRDMTNNFGPNTQRSVPVTIGYERCVPWTMSPTELRDALQENRLGKAARERLASDIDSSVATVAALEGTLVYTKSSAASNFTDVAAIEGMMNRVGISTGERFLFLSTLDYNGLAGDLANRANMQDVSLEAYRRAKVGMVSGFDTYKLDTHKRLTAAAGGAGLTIDTRTSALNYYVPQARSVASTGQESNVDNRTQTVTISSTTSVAAGDCFTIAGITEVHHITKEDTGELKTFRVIEVLTATTMKISPPITSNQGLSKSEEQYQNVTVATSATAAIVFKNTVTKAANPFWHKEAIVITPGRYAIPKNAGVAVMRATTENGIELTMTKFYDIKTMSTFFRVDVRYGVTMVAPEMAGVALFSQT